MAKTYEPIQVLTTTNATTNSVTFTSIPQTYTDLVLVCSVLGATSSAWTVTGQYNSDTATNYSFTSLLGNGTSASSSRSSSASNFQVAGILGGLSTTNPITGIVQIMNYSNTTTYKTGLTRDNDASGVVLQTHLWRNTAAITSIRLFMTTATYYFANNSVFTLYGIKAA